MVAAIALGFAACNNEDGPEVSKGDTYASVTISTAGSSTRAINDDQTDNAGTAAESGVTTVDMKSNLSALTWSNTELSSAGTPVVWSTTLAKQATPGPQQMALLLNRGSVSVTNDPDATYGTAATAIADIAELTGTHFLMTSDMKSYNILPNISKDVSEAGSTPNENVFAFDVERVVAKGIVAKDASYTTAVGDNTGTIGTGVTFAAVNGATKTYVLRDHAGSRTMAVEDPNQYANFTSVIDASTFAATAEAAVTQNLLRLGNLAPHPTNTNDDLVGYKAIAINDVISDINSASGIYFLENSGELTSENKANGFYRFAYAKVYVTFTPAKVYSNPTNTTVEFVADATTGLWYNEQDLTAPPKSTNEGGSLTQGYVKFTNALTENTFWTSGQTFYKGETDGFFYSSKTAAASSPYAPGQRAYTYTDGKAGYRALWNRQSPDSDDKLVNNADTRRNNIYVLKIKLFAKIGMPYDSSDPNDPNLPKPDDITEPITNPDDPNIEKQDTYMRVTAKILPWNVVGRQVVLE